MIANRNNRTSPDAIMIIHLIVLLMVFPPYKNASINTGLFGYPTDHDRFRPVGWAKKGTRLISSAIHFNAKFLEDIKKTPILEGPTAVCRDIEYQKIMKKGVFVPDGPGLAAIRKLRFFYPFSIYREDIRICPPAPPWGC
jgi:hypothetical protein